MHLTLSKGIHRCVAPLILVAAAVVHAEIPPLDLWTEKTVDPWSAGPMSKDRVRVKINTQQLVGGRAIELIASPGATPVTFSLSLGKPWDLRDVDHLVFAWRVLEGRVKAGAYPQVTVWAKNEIGEGYSKYRSLVIDGKWQHLRLDLGNPDEADKQYGKASRRGIERIDFVFPTGDAPLGILVDDLHFETSAALVLERARALGPLQEDIRPERYARFLCGDHLPPAKRPALEAKYAPQSPIPETPHRKPGKPLAQGPLRVLFIVNMAFQREIIELGQRFEMRYDFVPLMLVQRYKPELLADIARNRYDVVVTSALKPDAQMQPFIDWLGEQVAQGTGWIAINSSGSAGDIVLPFALDNRDALVNDRWQKIEDHPIIEGVTFAGFGPFQSRQYKAAGKGESVIVHGEQGHAKLAVSTHGKGRVANLCSGQGNSAFSLLPAVKGSVHVRQYYPYWEYEYAMLAKAMIWAARRTPAVKAWPTGEMTLQRGVDRNVQLSLIADRDFIGTIDTAWQRLDGVYHARRSTNLRTTAGKESHIDIPLPGDLPRGINLLDITIRNPARQVEYWATFAYTIDSGLAIERISGIDSDRYRRGDSLAFTVDVRNPEAAKGAIQYEIVDSWDRIIYRKTFEGQLAKGQFTTAVDVPVDSRFLTDVHQLKVTLFDAQGVADVAFKRVYTPVEPSEKHKTWWVGATAGGSNMHPHIYRHIAAAIRTFDVNAVMTNGWYQADQAELLVDNNLWVTPENIIWTGGWNKRYPSGIRKPCLSDPREQERFDKQAAAFAKDFRRLGPIGYASMEEHSLCTSRPNGTVCKGPHCRKRFVEWLRTQYPDIAALNAQWETDLATWDDVEPLRWEDGANRLDNPSRWIDFRMFMETVYTGMQRRFNDSIRGADPTAYVGYNCGIYGINPFAGFNRTRLGRISNFSIEYQPSWLEDRGVSTTMELLIDAAPHMKIGYCVGYNYMDLDPQRYWFKAWWMALRQQYGPFYYTINNDASTFADYSYIKIHASLADNGFTKEIRETTHALTRGIGKLFLNGDRQVDIAVYHSQASMMRRYYESHRFPQDVAPSPWDIRKLIREADLDYRRIVNHQLLAGKTKNYKAILLPDCVSLSDREWTGIEKYIRGGGTVIAFARTGITDDHGRYRSDQRLLSAVFGVKNRQEAFTWRKDQVSGATDGGLSGITGEVAACTPVEIIGAAIEAVFGNGDAAISRRTHGQGQAIYCNFSHRLEPTADNIRILTALLDIAKVDRRFLIERDGHRAGGFQSFRYRIGPIEFFGLLQTLGSGHQQDTELTLKLTQGGHIYDVLRGDYLGQSNVARFKAPGRGSPVVFARLPYAVESVTVDGAKSAHRGEPYSFAIEIGGARDETGTHVVRLEVFDPDMNPVEPYTRNLIAARGRVSGQLPLAYNDPVGVWTITAHDVISGKTAAQTLELQ